MAGRVRKQRYQGKPVHDDTRNTGHSKLVKDETGGGVGRCHSPGLGNGWTTVSGHTEGESIHYYPSLSKISLFT